MTAAEVTNWGLSFQEEGKPPVGNATAEYLQQYDSLYCVPTEEKVLYLTFDAGFENGNTGKILDALKKHQVKATFFLVGNYFETQPDLVKRMVEEGHTVGNHTYSHVKLSGMAPEAACEEIRKTSDLIQEITGKPAEYIRPPFGEWDKSLECGLTLFPVLWTVDTLDWTTENVSDVVRRGTEKVKDGDVILLHDCYASSVKAALEIIDTLKSRGFQFVTADELILE